MTWMRRFGLWLCGLTVVVAVAGCASERKVVRIHEETREGEVEDVPPGDEMIVE